MGSGPRTLRDASASSQLQGASDTLSSSCFQPYLQVWAACLGDQRPQWGQGVLRRVTGLRAIHLSPQALRRHPPRVRE